MSTEWRRWVTAPRFAPLAGFLIGALGGAVYWLATLLWPTSVALVLSMAAVALVSARMRVGADDGASGRVPGTAAPAAAVFAVLVKYNALMALSAANLPFTLPANLALGLVMIAGEASSRAVTVSATPASHGDLVIAMAMGFAPAALTGMPGLFGLLAAIGARIGFVAYLRRDRLSLSAAELDMTRQLAEICFYLGALATWPYA